MKSWARLDLLTSGSIGLLSAALLLTATSARALETESSNGNTRQVRTVATATDEVQRMLDAKVDGEVIKAYIKNTRISFQPNAADIIRLKEHGASPEVLTTLIERSAELRAQASQRAQVSQRAQPAPTAPPTQPAMPPPAYSAPETASPPVVSDTSPVIINYPTTYLDYPYSSGFYPYGYASYSYSYPWYGWWPSLYFGYYGGYYGCGYRGYGYHRYGYDGCGYYGYGGHYPHYYGGRYGSGNRFAGYRGGDPRYYNSPYRPATYVQGRPATYTGYNYGGRAGSSVAYNRGTAPVRTTPYAYNYGRAQSRSFAPASYGSRMGATYSGGRSASMPSFSPRASFGGRSFSAPSSGGSGFRGGGFAGRPGRGR